MTNSVTPHGARHGASRLAQPCVTFAVTHGHALWQVTPPYKERGERDRHLEANTGSPDGPT
jgi:hypothetical protein